MTTTLDTTRLENVKRNGVKTTARCPVCAQAGGDTTGEHLVIYDSGKFGCVMFPQGAGVVHRSQIKALVGVPETPALMTHKRLETTYDYTDKDGKLLYQVCRYVPKDFRQRRPDGNGYAWNMDGVDRVLYRLPSVTLATTEGHSVIVCEGEKACDALSAIGLTATCSPGGAEKWLPSYAKSLTGAKRVIVLPDNDTVGRKHANQVLASLNGTPGFCVTLPNLPHKGDAADWVAAGGNREQFINIVAQAEQNGTAPAKEQPLSERADTIKREKIEWVWPSRFPLAKLSIIVGDPGTGKSHAVLDMAAIVSKGDTWPDGSGEAKQGNVIILSAEDGAGDTIVPRLEAARATLSNIHIFPATIDYEAEDGTSKTRTFNLEADRDLLERELTLIDNVRLVIIDPVSCYMGGIDSHKMTDVRGFLAPLAALADRYRVAVLCVHHLNKGQGSAMNRISGSMGFAAAARSVYVIQPDQKDEDRRLLLSVKNNNSKKGGGLAFLLEPDEHYPEIAYVAWQDGVVDISADDALAQDGYKPMYADCMDWMTGFMEDEEKPAADVYRAGKEEQFAPKVIRVAAEKLGMQRRREGYGPGSRIHWKLPGGGIDATT